MTRARWTRARPWASATLALSLAVSGLAAQQQPAPQRSLADAVRRLTEPLVDDVPRFSLRLRAVLTDGREVAIDLDRDGDRAFRLAVRSPWATLRLTRGAASPNSGSPKGTFARMTSTKRNRAWRRWHHTFLSHQRRIRTTAGLL